MENSMRFGLMAVFAVSGSMVLLVHQVHKRLLSNFMKKFEFEMGGTLCAHAHKNLGSPEKHQIKKKVRFAKQVLELPLENKSYGRKVTRAQRVKSEDIWVMENTQKWRRGPKLEDIMPPNRAVLYRGIMKYKTLHGRLRF
ncbi:uncharacterized protein LOC133314665 isoform X2 [Gastrolobium bilobum]|uniref:uncharacterized protein LOC133314665 isoform X2 n=1 Tax=Gastrolobium bilobum TaxID=150636 RepID=UPI002AB1731D|nr:uncharacterized protein LOC133314665 isoform X2 [Gastrolobium bilobum]